MNELWTFNSLYTQYIKSWMVQQLNNSIKRDKPTSFNHGGGFDIDDILEISITFLLAIIEPLDSWRAFVRDKTRKGVKRVALEFFIKYLSYDPEMVNDIKQ